MLELEQILLSELGGPQVALIAIDQQREDSQVARLEEIECLLGYLCLPQDREWFATTPLRLRISDGVCVAASVIERWE